MRSQCHFPYSLEFVLRCSDPTGQSDGDGIYCECMEGESSAFRVFPLAKHSYCERVKVPENTACGESHPPKSGVISVCERILCKYYQYSDFIS